MSSYDINPWPCLFCILLCNWASIGWIFSIFYKIGFMGNYFFLIVDLFFVIGFVTGMGSGAFSLFEIENWFLKRKVMFSSVFFNFFGNFLVTFRVKKRISFSRSRWTKLKTTDLEKSVRTDLGKKRFDCRSSKWPKRFAQKCKFWTNFFSTLDFIGKNHSFQFLAMPSLILFWGGSFLGLGCPPLIRVVPARVLCFP